MKYEIIHILYVSCSIIFCYCFLDLTFLEASFFFFSSCFFFFLSSIKWFSSRFVCFFVQLEDRWREMGMIVTSSAKRKSFSVFNSCSQRESSALSAAAVVTYKGMCEMVLKPDGIKKNVGVLCTSNCWAAKIFKHCARMRAVYGRKNLQQFLCLNLQPLEGSAVISCTIKHLRSNATSSVSVGGGDIS